MGRIPMHDEIEDEEQPFLEDDYGRYHELSFDDFDEAANDDEYETDDPHFGDLEEDDV